MRVGAEIIAPPRLLLGVALLYWGAVAQHPMIGLGCAFLVEARWWVDVRWKFGEKGFSRAWKLSVLLLIVWGAWLWFQGESVSGVFDLLIWLPLLFLPVLLAQQYAEEERMPLNTFSYVAKRKMQIDRIAGRAESPILVHVGYAFFCVIMISACLADPSILVSSIALVVLGGVALFYSSPLGRMRPVSWLSGVVAAISLALFGATGINVAWKMLHGESLGLSSGGGVGDEAHTAIGSLADIKLSYRIRWRIAEEEPGPIRLFRTAVYNRYGHGIWTHRPAPPIMLRRKDYSDMASVGGSDGEEKQWAFRAEDLQSAHSWKGAYRVRGEVDPRLPTLLPMGAGVRVLKGVEVDFVSYNPLGTVRAENPDHSVVDFQVEYASQNLPENEGPPHPELDLHLPADEKAGLARINEELDLKSMPDEEKVQVLRRFYIDSFAYSLDLSEGVVSGISAKGAVTRFLEDTRIGHCEYFGSATTLLLRQVGVPARYCEGFGAQEWDQNRREWVLRGIHAHAWCRAYLGGHVAQRKGGDGSPETYWTGGRWVDVDLTPPDWLMRERQGTGSPLLANVIDWWQRFREDLLIWRTRPANRVLVTVVMSMLGILLLAYIVVRMWKHRTRRERIGRNKLGHPKAIATPLHALERSAEQVLGRRPVGESLTRWLLGLRALLPGEQEALRTAVTLHWKARFDPLGVEDAEREQLEMVCQDLREHIRQLRKR